MNNIDVMDIQKRAPFAYDGTHLDKIFDMQLALINIGINKNQQIGINMQGLDKPEYQQQLRDFMGYMVEELVEAMEQYEAAMDLFRVGIHNANMSDKTKVIKNFNKELGDVMHFMVEIMIYSNISPWEIKDYYDQYHEILGIKGYNFNHSILQTCFATAAYHNVAIGNKSGLHPTVNIFNIDEDTDPIFTAGVKLGESYNERLQLLAYRVIYFINKAKNQLKNKPWKTTITPTNKIMYEEMLMETWMHLFMLYDHVGFTYDKFYEVYYKVNQVNIYRHNNNY